MARNKKSPWRDGGHSRLVRATAAASKQRRLTELTQENKRLRAQLETTAPKTALLLLLGIDLLLHVAEMNFNLYTVVTMGRLLSTCTTLREWTNVMWAKVAEMFILPLQPLLTRMPSFDMATVQRITKKLRSDQWDFVGRQREADAITDLDNVTACSEHSFHLRTGTKLHGERALGMIRWKCTHSAEDAPEPATCWCHENCMAKRGQDCLTLTSIEVMSESFDPCEYTFDLRHNGMMIVLRNSKVIGPNAANILHQIAWGVLNLGSMQLMRTEVLPIPV